MRTRTTMRMLTVLLVFSFALLPLCANAERPETPPPGMGVYIMVLWPAGTPVPGDPKGTVKHLPEPDVSKLDGRLLHKLDNKRMIMLPLAAAKGLRTDEAVVYLQRVWMGESLDGWDETRAKSTRLVPKTEDADQNLQWGPKAYGYDGSGNIKQIGGDHYVYDSAGRLITATVNNRTENYSYDAFGNLTSRGETPISIPVDTASNRLIGVTYDAAGNVTSGEGRRTYTYDSLDSMSRVQPPVGNERRMIYDADDERIGTLITNDVSSQWTFRDFDGRVLREYEAFNEGGGQWLWWTWEQDHFYGDGILLGGETQSFQEGGSLTYGGPRHDHLDHLGSVRLVTDTSAHSISEHDYFPFGTTLTHTFQEEINFGDEHVDANRFAGHVRDFLGSLNVDNADYIDYMHARYYSPLEGRFLSPDPVVGVAAMTNPQRWNRYSYVSNNPVRYTDPMGRCFEPADCAAELLLPVMPHVVAATLAITFISRYSLHAQMLMRQRVEPVVVPTLTPGRQPTNLPPPSPPSTPSRPTTPGTQTTTGVQTGVPGTQATTGINLAAPIQAQVVNTINGPVTIPSDYVSRPADNGKGTVYQAPGATGNADMIRVMDPTTRYPNGYVVIYNPNGQPVTMNGKPGSREETHHPIEEQKPTQ